MRKLFVSIVSFVALLIAAPVFAQAAPTPITAPQGSTAVLTATADGTAPFTYQWKKDGVALAGSTSAGITLANVQPAANGTYSCVIANSAGQAVAEAVFTMTVAAPSNPKITGSVR